jgi:hypothetical protein
MQQETLTHQMKSVVQQMLFAYVITSIGIVTLFKINYFKVDSVFTPAIGDRDPNDLRQNSSALFPSESYVDFLHQPDIQKKIGAEVQYLECPDAPFELFVNTGDVRFCLLYL